MKNANKRKSSVPNPPFDQKNTRNPKKGGAGSAFMNRHFSTERSQVMTNKRAQSDYQNLSQANPNSGINRIQSGN